VLSLSVLLILVSGGVVLSPFWAPDLAPLLPWGATSGGQTEEFAALAARVAAIESHPMPPAVDMDALKSAIGAVARRGDQLENAVNSRLADIEKRPVPAGIDVDAIKSAQAALTHRIDQLEERLAAAEAQSSVRAASAAAGLEKINGELSRLRNATADLAKRVPELEQLTKSQRSVERSDAALALVMLRIREAVDRGHPFAAEYSALQALARDTDLSAETEPLADAARSGVASRAVLSKRLAELAGQVATATEPPSQSDWGAQTLARLRALVTIRRINGPSQTAPEAAVSTAQAALARGDLPGAVAALEPLTGANAEAGRPWLQMARQRLAVETALDRLQQSLADRLGPPQAAPAELGAKTKAPS
jgi:hypothetical protein